MKDFLKKLLDGIWAEIKKNFWFWAAIVVYAFGEKEIALAWILYGIYDKAEKILDHVSDVQTVEIVTLPPEKAKL